MTSLSFRKSAHGQSVCLEKLIQLLKSHSLTHDEEALLERYCTIHASIICSLYRLALRKKRLERGFPCAKKGAACFEAGSSDAGTFAIASPCHIQPSSSLLFLCFVLGKNKNREIDNMGRKL